jgi:1,4-dihydroxy-2-naphthoate octaprenyltransferase
MNLTTILQSTRPAFLVLPIVCVLLGLSLAPTETYDLTVIGLITAAAFCSHISVNALNEYFDFKSGLDFKTRKTPFSGGSGALPNNPDSAKAVFYLGVFSLLITVMIGFYFVAFKTLAILPLGLAGATLVITYTQWINRSPLICLIAPGVGFGLLMITGTYLLLVGEYAISVWLVALVPFFLINNLLLLNQYPDTTADAEVGRRTFPIAFGFNISHRVYALFALTSYSLIPVLTALDYLPKLAMVALLPSLLSLFAWSGARQYAGDIGEHPKYLAANVMATLLVPLLLAMALIADQQL